MKAGGVRMGEGDHVMVAPVDAMQKGDAPAGMVGEAHAEDAGVEVDRLRHVPGEQEDVRETAGKGPRGSGATGAPRVFGPVAAKVNADFSLGDDFSAALISIRLPSWS